MQKSRLCCQRATDSLVQLCLNLPKVLSHFRPVSFLSLPMFKRLVSAVVIGLSLLVFSGCSNVPDMATSPVEGPTIYTVVNHINCELAFVVNSSPDAPRNWANRRIFEYAEKSNDLDIWRKLRMLKRYHFVASVLLTLDVSNNEGVAPSLTFIQPLAATFSRTLSVGGSVSATQERNKSFSYSVDLANVEKGCNLDQPPPSVGIDGPFGLADIVIEGLNGLGASQFVNIYGSGGPTTPSFDASASAGISLTCTPQPQSDGQPDPCSKVSQTLALTLNGTVNFSPSGDAQLPGTISFAGEAGVGGQPELLVNLAGSTKEADSAKGETNKTRFLLSGTMTREGSPTALKELGFAPSITLVGFVERVSKTDRYVLSITTGQVTPSSETGAKFTYSVSAPPEASDLKHPKPHTQSQPELSTTSSASAGGAATTTVTAKAASSPASSNTTQFSSLISFTLGLSANSGPNWTLSSFKGPGGGGAAGQLLSAGHTTTDNLSLTFVAACQNESHPITAFRSYWDTIPKCNGTQQAVASAIGYQNNQLIQAFRGQ